MNTCSVWLYLYASLIHSTLYYLLMEFVFFLLADTSKLDRACLNLQVQYSYWDFFSAMTSYYINILEIVIDHIGSRIDLCLFIPIDVKVYIVLYTSIITQQQQPIQQWAKAEQNKIFHTDNTYTMYIHTESDRTISNWIYARLFHFHIPCNLYKKNEYTRHVYEFCGFCFGP